MNAQDEAGSGPARDGCRAAPGRGRPPRLLPLLAALLLLAATAALAIALLRGPGGQLFRDRSALGGFLEHRGSWAPLALMALQAAQVLAAPIPGHVLGLASGYFFGPWRGTLYTVIGVAAGSALLLSLVRLAGRPLIARWVSASALQRIDVWAARRGPLFFFLVFLLPFLPDDLACVAIGLSALPVIPMLAVLTAARLPGHFLAAWIGSRAGPLPPAAWIAGGAVAIAIAVLYRRHHAAIERWLLRSAERVS